MRLTKLITIALAATAILLLAIESGRQRIQLILMQRELTTALENERDLLRLAQARDKEISALVGRLDLDYFGGPQLHEIMREWALHGNDPRMGETLSK